MGIQNSVPAPLVENFSYDNVVDTKRLKIPLNQQMIVFQKLTNSGTIVNDGEIVIIEAA
jgi:hypothetical protein